MTTASADEILTVIANRRRREILNHLARDGEVQVGELVRRLDIAQSALSQHLALMREAGIVSTRRAATAIFYSLTDDRTRRVLSAIEAELESAAHE